MNHVGEKSTESGPDGASAWLAQFEGALGANRTRARKLVSDHRQHIRQVASRLDDQIRRLERDLRIAEENPEQSIDAQVEYLNGLKQDLSGCQSQWQQLQDAVGQQQSEFLEQLRGEQQRLEEVRNQLEAQQREFSERTEGWQRKIEQREADDSTRSADLLEETNKLRDELSQQTKMMDALSQEVDQLRQQRDQLQRQIESKDSNEKTDSQILELQNECDQLRSQIESQTESEQSLSGSLDELRSERDDLRQQLAHANEQIESANGQEDQAEEVAALWQRVELAMDEIHELRDKNEQLERQLANAGESEQSPVVAVSANADWETQKKLLLSQLESDGESADEEVQEQRLKIEETIRITNHAVKQKDEEIEELRSLLNQQSNNIGEVAVGAAAIEEAFLQDELIRQERENLKELQVEWREKMRKSEIEISTERAKLARERLQMEEKLQMLEQARPNSNDSNGQNDEKSANRRGWLSRLGLADSAEDE